MKVQGTIASFLLIALTVSAVTSEDTTTTESSTKDSPESSKSDDKAGTTEAPKNSSASSKEGETGNSSTDKGGNKDSKDSKATEAPDKSKSEEPSSKNGSGESSKDTGEATTEGESQPTDCTDILRNNKVMSGVYKIQPDGVNKTIKVFCDMTTDGGGWTVFQKRGDYPGFKEDDFIKKWDEYKNGFGNPKKEYWLGNDNLFALTNQNSYYLRVDLSDIDGNKAYAEYTKFLVGDEDSGYQLTLGRYAGGGANDALSYHNRMKFSTIDRDNDKNPTASCANSYHGGWWYNSCLHANLNGLNLQGPNNQLDQGITWYDWRGSDNSLSFVEMKIRPRDF